MPSSRARTQAPVGCASAVPGLPIRQRHPDRRCGVARAPRGRTDPRCPRDRSGLWLERTRHPRTHAHAASEIPDAHSPPPRNTTELNMSRDGRSARLFSGFLSAVVADSRTAMPHRSGASTHQPHGPHELVVERVVDPSRPGPPDAPALRARQPAAARPDGRVTEAPVAPVRQAVTYPGNEVEPRRPPQADAADSRTAPPPGETIREQAADRRSDPRRVSQPGGVGPRPSPPSESPARHHDRPRQPQGIHRSEPFSASELVHGNVSTRPPFVDRPDTSARAGGEPGTPDFSAAIRDRVVPATDGGGRSASPVTRGQPQSASPAVHIGTLDVRIEAAKPPSQPRQPVCFRGSGILSRLYLRRV